MKQADLFDLWKKLDALRGKSDDYTKELGSKQNNAKESLRLKEVYAFAEDIKYSNQITNIETFAEEVIKAEIIKKE